MPPNSILNELNSPKSILITNTNIICPTFSDIEDNTIYNASILIENSKISQIISTHISSNISANTKNNSNTLSNILKKNPDIIIDGSDNYILPGFIDTHVHLMANGFKHEDTMYDHPSMHFYKSLENMRLTLDAGVTTVRDAGLVDYGTKMAAEMGMFPAPKMQISVMPLSITGGHFDFTLDSGYDMLNAQWLPHPVCDGDNVLQKTREVLRAKADVIKVMATGGVFSNNDAPEFAQFTLAELKTIVDEASARGNTKVIAHAHGLEGIINSIEAGVHSIEHGTYIDKNTAKLMVEKEIYLVPTFLVINENKEMAESGKLTGDRAKKAIEVAKVHSENIKMAYNEGVKILMGTDSGVIPHGNNLKELDYLVNMGMSPIESIASGTISAATAMGIEKSVGSIAIEKSGDIILINKNPLDDIEVLGDSDNIKLVIQNGKIVKNIL
ncbi:MAG: amidohydrolase family protein [Methanobacteriaceae archaeon]